MKVVEPIVLAHAIAAAAALVLGPLQFLNRSGSRPHRIFGYVWVALMIFTAVSSFWIVEIFDGWFSPIHLLSIVTLAGLASAITYAKRHNMRGHRSAMMWTYAGLVGAFVFTLLPGRFTHSILFGF